MHCSECGSITELERDSVSCSYCGRDLTVDGSPEQSRAHTTPRRPLDQRDIYNIVAMKLMVPRRYRNDYIYYINPRGI